MNVLQSVVLTDGAKMALTPTWHVFELYNAHHGAKAADCFVETDKVGPDKWSIDRISASASQRDGAITLTVANCSMDEEAAVRVVAPHTGKVSGRILAGEAHQYNGFDDSPVASAKFTDFAADSRGVDLRLPPCSVAALTLA